jgi:alkylation response protein AidB-like acyl-CoA dehydrogenase
MPERENPRRPQRRRHTLCGEWAKNVDFQRRFCRYFHRFCQSWRGEIHGLDSRRPHGGHHPRCRRRQTGHQGFFHAQVFFENVKVPAENVLGEIGKGHLIAFNALNIGRFKLGVMCIGGNKEVINMAVSYANERIQFGQPIGNFGAIQYKLAEMAIRNFAAESAAYRTSQCMQDKKAEESAEGKPFGQATLEAAEEYAIECSI